MKKKEIENKRDKLDFSLDQINNEMDNEMELCKKIENSKIYAKTLLWLAHSFLKEKKQNILNKELANFLKQIPQYTTQILEIFIMHNIVGCYKRGHFRATIYFLKERKLLEDCISTAKKTLNIK